MEADGKTSMTGLIMRCRAALADDSEEERRAYVRGVEDALQAFCASATIVQRDLGDRSPLHAEMYKSFRNMTLATVDLVRELIPEDMRS